MKVLEDVRYHYAPFCSLACSWAGKSRVGLSVYPTQSRVSGGGSPGGTGWDPDMQQGNSGARGSR